MKSQVRVCVNINCCQKGSQEVASALTKAFAGDEVEIKATENCFRFCKSGPNVAVNGALLHNMSPLNAEKRVRLALAQKGVKKEAIGTRPLDELDAALDEMMNF
ncbi:MAG: (2Fe-2S) ferredoxin domain-containing protein [Candidatus Moranbacteria bacterium]|jgi:NADH:ubiquinone oxidoreductase subunit E|nr:(2Fe-2S) ferredoxin domain-containing protein [Candidatus Moranbacteria bacterium]MBP9801921.1 (2Fe-2S) ferredoxin domain-containing protein [Candidatus Moranbacteria bacterium]